MSESEFWALINRLEGQIRSVKDTMTNHIAGFDLAVLWLSAAMDAKAVKARLEALQQATQETAAAQAQLAADREAHERRVAEETADLDRRRTRAADAEIQLKLRTTAFDQREARREASVSSEDHFPHDPNFNPGSRSHTGLVRDRHHE